jgi:hypothetical protein
MTSEGQKCFLNAICYIQKFDGQKPLVAKTSSGRRWVLVYAGYMKTVTDENFTKNLFPQELYKRFGKDADQYIRYYQENMEYLHSAGGRIEVDEDVKGLGLSNRKIELLDRCVSLLEDQEKRDLALRILKRYTLENFQDAKEWREWLEKNRDRLFFTDTGGYKFMTAPASVTTAAKGTATTSIPRNSDK